MALIVQKYGGTSVGSIELIRRVADKVIARQHQGNQMVVVLSAMAGETDRLLRLAHEMSPEPNLREVDVLISTGEQQSVALFGLACQAKGVEAVSILGFQARIETDEFHGRSCITGIDPVRIQNELDQNRIVVVAGFQGINGSGDVTTLGRGGSDTTAVALASALKAEVCEIFTDVDGVYTTDPHLHPKARKMRHVSYEEMLELSSAGAKVMETRSIEFAMRYGVRIHVRHSQKDEIGTIISEEEEAMEDRIVSGVAYNKNEARITVLKVPDMPGMAAKILGAVSDAGIVVDMIIQNTSAGQEGRNTDFSFTVPQTDFQQAMALITQVAEEIGAERVLGDDNIAKISIVGVGMRTHAGVATKMFQTLANEGINIRMISTSEIKISCVITQKYTELAVRALHDAFELDK
jgi:aspartate kinase